jgi:hypothetical protein
MNQVQSIHQYGWISKQIQAQIVNGAKLISMIIVHSWKDWCRLEEKLERKLGSMFQAICGIKFSVILIDAINLWICLSGIPIMIMLQASLILSHLEGGLSLRSSSIMDQPDCAKLVDLT